MNTQNTTKRVVLAARPVGKPKGTDFRLEEVPVPDPGAGQLLLRTRYLSLDPYMRGRMDAVDSYSPYVAIGDVMVGQSIADVLISHHPDHKVGDIVLAHTGWQTLSISDGERIRKLDPIDAPITTGGVATLTNSTLINNTGVGPACSAWNGQIYGSLSKVAFAITGTRWNGPRFFGLRDKQAPTTSEAER